jgi:hypothetical protein
MEETVHDSPVGSPAFWIEQWRRSSVANAFGGYALAATWNVMAETYGRGGGRDEGGRGRGVAETIALLEQGGVELEGRRVLDIGCGPGSHAAAFARRGARVVCIDVAGKMIERLEREVAAAERERITPLVADWVSLDLAAHEFVGAFDLVFANMTPAVAGPEAFLKIMKASRRWCWFRGWAGPRENPLLEAVHEKVFGEPPAPFAGNFLYAYNVACASGYFPGCSFERVEWTREKPVDECVELYTTMFGPRCDVPHETLRETIAAALSARAREGLVETTMRGHTGRMLWDLKDTTGGTA